MIFFVFVRIDIVTKPSFRSHVWKLRRKKGSVKCDALIRLYRVVIDEHVLILWNVMKSAHLICWHRYVYLGEKEKNHVKIEKMEN